MGWLRDGELRVGLGAMRLSTERTRDEAHARAVIHAALEAGVRVFDTAGAYGLDERDPHHNERWLGQFLGEHARGGEARVVTKGGMLRAGPRWIPDGRAATLERHCGESLAALGRPIDLYLLHVPDPKTPWLTSVRALAKLKERGLVRAIGLSNVTRTQLDQALGEVELAAVQLGVSVLDDTAIRGGVVAGALQREVTVLCHSPLGGPKKFRQLGTTPWLVEKAKEVGCTPWEWALAQLLSLHPQVMVLPGAKRVETVQSCVRAAGLSLGPRVDAAPPTAREGTRPVVRLLMGVQGAGKTSAVTQSVSEGFTRLNRDTEGGTLEQLHTRLGGLLAQGRSVVLDNTYVTRAQRGRAIQVARRHGAEVQGVWHDVSTEQAQVNIVLRMLEVHGRLLSPAELKQGKTPDSLGPTGFLATVRALEPLGEDEGFTSLERRAFTRRPWPWPEERPALFVGLDALGDPRVQSAPVAWPRIVLGWKEGGGVALPAGFVDGVCAHEGGPPSCWCRPPLPGFALLHARALKVSLGESRLISTSPSFIKLADALGVPR